MNDINSVNYKIAIALILVASFHQCQAVPALLVKRNIPIGRGGISKMSNTFSDNQNSGNHQISTGSNMDLAPLSKNKIDIKGSNKKRNDDNSKLYKEDLDRDGFGPFSAVMVGQSVPWAPAATPAATWTNPMFGASIPRAPAVTPGMPADPC